MDVEEKAHSQQLSELSAAHQGKPVIPAPAGLGKADRELRAKTEAARVDRIVGLRNQRVLEVGCGHGEMSFEIASAYGADTVGVEVRDMEGWRTLSHPNLSLVMYDLTAEDPPWPTNSFTRIVSRAVWEHIRHPFTALKRCRELLAPGGKMYLYANLYRSAVASHLYREIPFPWPHLLFPPETLASWLGRKEIGWAFWVNKLTYAQYLLYFKLLGFYVTFEMLHTRPIDREFFNQHEHRLGLYPEFDLGLDFFEVVLEFDPERPKEPIPDPIYRFLKKPRSS